MREGLDPAAFRGNLGTYRRRDLLGEARKLVLALSPEHERVEAVTDRQVGELVDPLVERTTQEADPGAIGDLAVDVDDPADLGRIPACPDRSIVEPGG